MREKENENTGFKDTNSESIIEGHIIGDSSGWGIIKYGRFKERHQPFAVDFYLQVHPKIKWSLNEQTLDRQEIMGHIDKKPEWYYG